MCEVIRKLLDNKDIDLLKLPQKRMQAVADFICETCGKCNCNSENQN